MAELVGVRAKLGLTTWFVGAALAAACSSSNSTPAPPGHDAGADSTAPSDASSDTGAPNDATADAPTPPDASSDAGPADAGPADSGQPDVAPGACPQQPASLSLSGTWAALFELSTQIQGAPGGAFAVCPANQVGTTTLLMLVTLHQSTSDPTSLDQVQAILCSMQLPTATALVGPCDPTSQALISTQLTTPPKLVAALPGLGPATATGSLSGTSPGTAITLNALDLVLGSTASGASLPTWDIASASCNQPNIGQSSTCDTSCVSDCAALRDDDMDGFPAVTVNFCGATASDVQSGAMCSAANPQTPGVTLQGPIYSDMEINPSITGTATSSCELEGNASSGLVYNVIGSNLFLAGSPITVTSTVESLPTFTVDAASSRVRMIRIDGQFGSASWGVSASAPAAACATLIANVTQL